MPNSTYPENIYHYTSMSGLLGIVTSAKLRASHIYYLNDQSEQRHVWLIIKGLIENRLAQCIPDREKKLLEDLWPAVEIVSNPSEKNQLSTHYVSSFSKNGDALSQWLSYCPHGNGFSIGFDPGCLSSANKGATLDEVQYFSREDPQSSWKHMLDYYITEPKLAIESIKALSPFVKDASFSADEEYRLVQNNPEHAMIRFRPGRSMLIPYIEFELNGETYFVKEVVVGPCPNPALSIGSVKLLFASIGHADIAVRESCVPYRAW